MHCQMPAFTTQVIPEEKLTFWDFSELHGRSFKTENTLITAWTCCMSTSQSLNTNPDLESHHIGSHFEASNGEVELWLQRVQDQINLGRTSSWHLTSVDNILILYVFWYQNVYKVFICIMLCIYIIYTHSYRTHVHIPLQNWDLRFPWISEKKTRCHERSKAKLKHNIT